MAEQEETPQTFELRIEVQCPPEMSADLQTVMTAYGRWAKSGEGVVLALAKKHGWVVMSALQLAMRHPGMAPTLGQVCREVATDLIDQLCDDDPELARIAHLGFDTAATGFVSQPRPRPANEGGNL